MSNWSLEQSRLMVLVSPENKSVQIRDDFPLTFNAFSQLQDGEGVLEHIADMESKFGNARPVNGSVNSGARLLEPGFDVLLAGGGLSLLYAIKLAKCGFSVAVADRRRIGDGHREWNISRAELEALSRAGVFEPEEIESIIRLQYDYGVVKWFGGEAHRVNNVLDCAVDSEKFLLMLREKAQEHDVRLFDFHSVDKFEVTSTCVRVQLSRIDQSSYSLVAGARLVIDARGALGCGTNFDIVCPTVGGVIGGLEQGDGERQVNSSVGEILVSTEGIEDGRQHIWEGFPSTEGRLTTYLFYYAAPGTLGANPLLSLYERFFSCIHEYKAGTPLLTRPTYGFIPGNTRLSGCDLSPQDRIYLVGDAAGRHSPLTFCGFGALVRSFNDIGNQLAECLEKDCLDRKTLNSVRSEREGLRVMGALALMMTGERITGSDTAIVNSLLEDAFWVLEEMGADIFQRLLRDEIRFGEFMEFMWRVAGRRPSVWREVSTRLTAGELGKWCYQATRFGLADSLTLRP